VTAIYALKHAILWLAAEVSLAYDVLLSPRVVPPAAWQKIKQPPSLLPDKFSALEEAIQVIIPQLPASDVRRLPQERGAEGRGKALHRGWLPLPLMHPPSYR